MLKGCQNIKTKNTKMRSNFLFLFT